jgi:hypothetical protein
MRMFWVYFDWIFLSLILLLNRTQYHVFDLTRPLATFSMYKMIDINSIEEPRGYVTFLINERIPRVTEQKKIEKRLYKLK